MIGRHRVGIVVGCVAVVAVLVLIAVAAFFNLRAISRNPRPAIIVPNEGTLIVEDKEIKRSGRRVTCYDIDLVYRGGTRDGEEVELPCVTKAVYDRNSPGRTYLP